MVWSIFDYRFFALINNCYRAVSLTNSIRVTYCNLTLALNFPTNSRFIKEVRVILLIDCLKEVLEMY